MGTILLGVIMFTGVVAVLHEHLAVDERVVVARRPLDVATGAIREVEHVLRLGQREAVEIDDVDVGVLALDQPSPLCDAEQVGGVAGQTPNRFFE